MRHLLTWLRMRIIKLIPLASSGEEAAAVYNNYYSVEDQNKYGVLVIEVTYLPDYKLN
jgi:ASC-1-like (ASCH) protein